MSFQWEHSSSHHLQFKQSEAMIEIYKHGEQNSLVQIESTNDPKFIKGMDPLGIIVIQIMRCSQICEILPEF